jgi:hypothetical protein
MTYVRWFPDDAYFLSHTTAFVRVKLHLPEMDLIADGKTTSISES